MLLYFMVIVLLMKYRKERDWDMSPVYVMVAWWLHLPWHILVSWQNQLRGTQHGFIPQSTCKNCNLYVLNSSMYVTLSTCFLSSSLKALSGFITDLLYERFFSLTKVPVVFIPAKFICLNINQCFEKKREKCMKVRNIDEVFLVWTCGADGTQCWTVWGQPRAHVGSLVRHCYDLTSRLSRLASHLILSSFILLSSNTTAQHTSEDVFTQVAYTRCVGFQIG